MVGIFWDIEASLRRIEKSKWYSRRELKRSGLYSPAFENGGKDILNRKGDHDVEVLGVSVLGYFSDRLNINVGDLSMSMHDWAIALGTGSAVYKFVDRHPEVRVNGRNVLGATSRIEERIEPAALTKARALIYRRVDDFDDRERRLLKLLPEFDVSFVVATELGYYSGENIETFASGIKVNPVIVEAGLYKLGIKRPRTRQEMVSLSERLFLELHPETKQWDKKEQKVMSDNYFFAQPGVMEKRLRRTTKDIEHQARLLGIERFVGDAFYSVRDVLRISGIGYEELCQALYFGNLRTARTKERNGELPKGAVLIKGDGLLRLFKERAAGVYKQWHWRRAERALAEQHANAKKGGGKSLDFWEAVKRNGEALRKEKGRVLDPEEYMSLFAKAVPRLSEEEEARLTMEKDTSLAARADWIEANFLGVFWKCHKLRKRKKGGILSTIDVLHSGINGLLVGVDNYDPRIKYTDKKTGEEKIVKPFTYALWWVRQHISRDRRTADDHIRMPSHVHDDMMKISRARRSFFNFHQREPSDDELKEKVGLTEEKFERTINAYRLAIDDLDAAVFNDGKTEMTRKDLIEDQRSPNPVEEVKEMEQRAYAMSLLNGLDKKTRNIMIWRLGLDGQGERTLNDVGEILGVTHERIRQLERKGMQKLRRTAKLTAQKMRELEEEGKSGIGNPKE